MPATRDGKTWRCQFYYEDWQGVRHKKNKRGFKTNVEAEEWKFNSYLADIEQRAQNLFLRLVNDLAEKENFTEQLKATDMML